ncbi:class I SAM-dependent methyltransferase [Microbacterium sp. JB110]|uniref:class I SAM-dependent methyltransferase n=1 Tax=Microbacterium sp. JB110 TaxID=2024477 RepID=UPI00097EB62C|nr:class I SAM-dependent methyltransferase [Microbacterium sp. JB110]RCS61179.1 SAM-dependent methyltransferase [Microbacterium sp. JB110]SJM69524.1 O-Methyltransferase involved in polyketide biosynthesis [Frigoribacterium sp. JB110]
MTGNFAGTPDNTAVRTALWRALHAQADQPPHVIDDTVGARLAQDDDGWRDRADMLPDKSRGKRGTIVGRARLTEDLVEQAASRGVDQYVILGAGLDTYAQRHPDAGSTMTIFEIDQPETQAWKRSRLIELGYGIPEWLRLVPVDFEANDNWWDRLQAAGFDASRPAVVSWLGVTMYLTQQATTATLERLASLPPGSTLIVTFFRPLEDLAAEDVVIRRASREGARRAGTPFIGFYTPDQIVDLAQQAGFGAVEHVSAADLADRYFTDRTDGLRPYSGEDALIATV